MQARDDLTHELDVLRVALVEAAVTLLHAQVGCAVDLATYYLLLTTHYSLPTTHYPLLTTHY